MRLRPGAGRDTVCCPSSFSSAALVEVEERSEVQRCPASGVCVGSVQDSGSNTLPSAAGSNPETQQCHHHAKYISYHISGSNTDIFKFLCLFFFIFKVTFIVFK